MGSGGCRFVLLEVAAAAAAAGGDDGKTVVASQKTMDVAEEDSRDRPASTSREEREEAMNRKEDTEASIFQILSRNGKYANAMVADK